MVLLRHRYLYQKGINIVPLLTRALPRYLYSSLSCASYKKATESYKGDTNIPPMIDSLR